MGVYPAYIRGQAYALLRRGGEAAAEFQKILDHRGIAVMLMNMVFARGTSKSGCNSLAFWTASMPLEA